MFLFSGRRSSKQQKTCIVIKLRSSTILYGIMYHVLDEYHCIHKFAITEYYEYIE